MSAGSSSMGNMKQQLADLSPEQRALLMRQLKQKGAKPSSRPPLTRRPENGAPPPLSFSQQRLWFLDQLEPGSSAYNLPVALRLDGTLRVDALERALSELVRRHESLRTTFQAQGDTPVQVISPPAPVSLPVTDLSAHAEREAEVRRRIEQDACESFALAHGPLLRASLLKLGEREHVMLLNMHHIVSDGWSMDVLVREMAALYAAFSAGHPARLPELPVQYADFAVWQRGWLRGEALDAQLSWWRKQLEGAPAALELPTDRPRPAVQSFRGATTPVHLPRQVSEDLLALCQREGVTSFMALLAVWQLLLSRYSGQDDVVVGSPIAGRRHAETEGLIGFFVNTLVFRTRLDGRATFRQLLAQVKASTLAAFEHQDVPFEKLVEELHPQRSLSHSPIFQVMLSLQNAPSQGLSSASADASGLRLRVLETELRTTKFDLSLSLGPSPSGFEGVLSYRTDLFDAGTTQRMVRHLQALLEHAVAAPDTALHQLQLMDAEERQRVLVAWNDTRRELPRSGCFHECFEARAASTPDALAVLDDSASLSFAQANRRANQLAHWLRARGVGPEVRVALCMERSVDMVVAVLGVLKAGGAYVPMDPAYPRERLAFMLQDCGAGLALTQRHLAERMEGSGVEPLSLDDEAVRAQLSREAEANPPHVSAPEHLAYVIYTSGSTGRPKGVMVQHASVMNLRAALASAVYAGAEGALRVSLNAPLAFDASVKQLIQVADGHALCVVPQAAREDVSLLKSWVEKHQLDVLDCSPSHLRLLLEEGLASSRALRVLVGGEAVDETLWAKLAAHPFIQCFNVYGPTECTVDTTARAIRGASRPSLGGPLANVQVYVLDERMQPVPTGVPGELFIGGSGVARGYLGRPELTAERFIPSPFGTGERLYRTGDKVRWLATGELDYLGRIDFQVKLRGFRIELGEIEAALEEVHGIRRAVVLAREDVPGNPRLVAYVVPMSMESTPSASELRAAIGRNLPEYMVPSAFVFLEALPLNTHGKVDRKALPAPDAASSTTEYIAPRTPTEQRLASVWSEVLGVPRVGACDDFFALGGHSLLATQLVSRLRSTFHVELPLRALFEAPTLEAFALRVDAALTAGQGVSLPPLRRAPRTGALPLSFAQQRLWFLDQLDPGGAAYNMPAALRLTGPLDISALQRALSELVRRHEVLRTSFKSIDDSPVQVVSDALVSLLQRVDLSGLPADTREAEALRLAEQEARKPFALATGPLLRTFLLRLDEREHVLLMTMHHIVSDGWSMGVLVREMAALYMAFSSGGHSPLPELSVQYADFAVWQRSWLQGEALEAQLSWWREHLAGAPAALELPTDLQRPTVQSFRGALVPVQLSRQVSGALKALCQKEGVTPFMALLAAWQLLLSRYSGQEDISVGSPIAGRRLAELEGLIGFFVNTLVLRTRMEDNPSFEQVLARVKETTLGAFAHQDIPFEKLVEELAPPRTLGRSPLFQVMFALQNAPASRLALPDLTIDPLPLDSVTSHFELELNLSEGPEGFLGSLTYNPDLFSSTFARRISQHFVTLLEGLVAQPTRPFHHLPLLSDAERQTVLGEWNHSPSGYPRNATLVDVFARHVASTPDTIAVEFGAERLTYRQLDARANQLAHVLQARGVGPDSRVALALERSLELIVSLLGILKAGGAYVPLDTAYPRERLAFMLEDARPALLVTTRELLAHLPAEALPTLLIEESAEALARAPDSAPVTALSPRNLAYIDFTSGSTGRPKGVCIEHASVLRTVLDVRYAELGAQHTFLLLAPISFDASTLEVWGPLLNGGRLVVFPPHPPGDPRELADVLQRHAVTTLHLTSGLFTQVVDGHLEGLRGVRQLLTGGDVVSSPHVRRVLEQLHIPVTACYGPTEGTLFTSCFRMTDASQVPASIPIGTPISCTQVYLLDAYLQPVPPGTPGELYVSGDGLARGYLQQPALTAERFLPNPFSTTPGTRLYRTGDLARHRADGVLEFLGRADFQVKIRGFRIELGEVETALLAHPEVREAVVLAREDVPGDKRLVGYVTARTDALDVLALRAFLQQRLPEYMVPSALLVLEALPLTPNAKVDRRALPAPDARPDFRPFVPPSSETEVRLAALWAELLGLPQVGALDDFFELGGHSLLATRLVSRLRASFHVELPLRALFEAPTLSALAQRLDAARSESPGVSLPPLTRVPRTDALPLSFAQQRLWFLDQLEPGSATYNMPAALRLTGALDVSALQRALSELVRRHESLRTCFPSSNGQPSQYIREPAPFPLPEVDLSSREDREVEARRLANEDAHTPFALDRGPLLRASLLRLEAHEHVLLLNMHHVISDGWSMGVLVRELAALYEAFCAGRPSPLLELPVQYADYAVWQRSWLQGDALEAQLSWWREHLTGAPPLLELPTDLPRPAVPSTRGAMLTRVLPGERFTSLHALCRREGATLFMALLAGFEAVLSRYSGQEDFVVGTDIANRNRAETEGLIGFFVNQLALRARLEGNPSFRELLGRVRLATLGAYAHQDLPFEEVVKALNPERGQGHAPLFQVKLVLQNQPAPELNLPGLTLRGEPLDSRTSRLDLTLSIVESERGLECACEYRTDLFEARTIDRMVGHLGTLLEAAAAQPDAPLSTLPLLSEEEQRQLLQEWNATGRDFPREACAHHLFEAQAARTPHATAVRFEGQALTYAQLDARANQLAHHLRALGVRPEVRVALCTERSLELVVGILGILKAGGAWVPLDASYPVERLTYMLRDCAAPVLVTTQALADELPAGGEQLVLLDADAALIDPRPITPLASGAGADSLAYVIYTSGSTGRPKGTLLHHRGLCNTALNAAKVQGFHADSRVLQFAAFGFDASVFEMFGALLAGATLVLAPRERLLPGAPLHALLREEAVTAVTLTPSVLAQLEAEDLPSLETIVSAGEACTPELVERWGHRVRMFNAYGPTEVTVCATVSEPMRPGQRITIGRPWGQVRVYVVDAALRPVPVGVPGELCVAGVGLSRGYQGRPELTAEKFLPNPFSQEPGARLYRTGDRVRWLVDGTLEYLGRLDAQVKLRGFRIELGEIESVLEQAPGILQAAVLAREDVPGHKQLVAYVVPSESDPVASEALRAFLKTKLPEHMLPAAFVTLEALPLTAHGKLDRQALPAPGASHRDVEQAFVPPKDALELEVAQAFEEVLDLRPIGARGHFFDLGGHSLLAVRLLAVLAERTHRRLPLSVLFKAPTVERLAAALRTEPGPWSPLVPIQRGGSRPPFFCVHPVGGNVLAYAELARRLGPEQPFYGLQSQGLDGAGPPLESVEEMAACYIEALRTVQPHGPYRLGGWSMGGMVAFEMARQLHQRGERVEVLALIDPTPPRAARSVSGEDPAHDTVEHFARDLGRLAGFELPDLPADAGPEELLQAILVEGRKRGALLPEAGLPELRALLQVFSANVRAVRGYSPGRLDGRLTVLRSADPAGLSAEAREHGWGDRGTQGVDVHEVPGDHYSLLQAPHVQVLADRLRALLDAASGARGGTQRAG